MIKKYCPYCGNPVENGCDCEVLAAEQHGWAQQDIIDMYRRER